MPHLLPSGRYTCTAPGVGEAGTNDMLPAAGCHVALSDIFIRLSA